MYIFDNNRQNKEGSTTRKANFKIFEYFVTDVTLQFFPLDAVHYNPSTWPCFSMISIHLLDLADHVGAVTFYMATQLSVDQSKLCVPQNLYVV